MVLFVIILILFVLWVMLRCASICDSYDEKESQYIFEDKSKKL